MLSEKPWKPESVALLLTAVLTSWFVGTILVLVFDKFASFKGQGDKLFVEFLVSSISIQGVTLVLVSVFLRLHDLGWPQLLGLTTPRVSRTVGTGLLVGLVVVPLALLLNYFSAELIKLMHMTPEDQPTIKVLQLTSGWGQRICFGVAAILVAPVVEEVLFRGILYPTIKQMGFPRLAIYGTSLLFAAIHANLMTFIPLTFFALVLIALYEKTDNLLAPITAHCFFNSVNFSLFIFQSDLERWWGILRERI